MAKKKKAPAKAGYAAMSPAKYLDQVAPTLPLGPCYIPESWVDDGEGIFIVTRRRPSGNLVLASFLVDTLCLGVKDTLVNINMPQSEFDEYLNHISETVELKEVPYEVVHNIIYGAIAWAEEGGIEPVKSFLQAEKVLEEDNDDIPLIEYEFGENGKHVLIVGTFNERQYIPTLEKNLGDRLVVVDEADMDGDDEYATYEDDVDEPDPAPEAPELVKYTYVNPPMPETLELIHPEVGQILLDPDNYQILRNRDRDYLLSLTADELARDLSQIIYYVIGRTATQINEGAEDVPYVGALNNIILLLNEIKSALAQDALLQLLRQSDRFLELHIGQYGLEELDNAVAESSVSRIGELRDFIINERGISSLTKCDAMRALWFISTRYPQTHEQVVAALKDIIREAWMRAEDLDGFDALNCLQLVTIWKSGQYPELDDLMTALEADKINCNINEAE